ncbi:IS200/IS605 family transposase [Patescibacteria group bacterium]|nr:IS200/IS605 family transposase [Patescibacteria group bacterium]MBU1953119.1 IS200/IS605 family transposase [Patescibacteria group bacterium]
MYEIQYHLVWGVKYRRKILKNYVLVELIKSIHKLQRTYPTWYIHKINTNIDHIHMLIEIPPKYSVAEVVQKIKIQTSKDLRKHFKFIDRIFGEKSGIWGIGYYVSTVGLNEEKILKYIAYQGKQDLGEDATSLLS